MSDADFERAINARGIPAGGSTDQVLAKASSADRDLKWADPGSGVTISNTAPVDAVEQVNAKNSLGGSPSDAYFSPPVAGAPGNDWSLILTAGATGAGHEDRPLAVDMDTEAKTVTITAGTDSNGDTTGTLQDAVDACVEANLLAFAAEMAGAYPLAAILGGLGDPYEGAFAGGVDLVERTPGMLLIVSQAAEGYKNGFYAAWADDDGVLIWHRVASFDEPVENAARLINDEGVVKVPD